MKQKNWSAKDILESAYYVVLLYKMKKKKHCGHQYVKVIHKVIIYLGPNLILQIPVPSPIWVWLESEWNWVLSNEIGYQFTNICTIFHGDKTWFLMKSTGNKAMKTQLWQIASTGFYAYLQIC